MASKHFAVGILFLVSLVLQSSLCVDWRLDLAEPEEEEVEQKECYGTYVGFGFSGTLALHYENLMKRYAGCTHIIGNLEITNLVDPNINYNLDFLRTIRYVSGSVLIGLITEVNRVPLHSLEIIRGNSTIWLYNDDYSLVVVLTAHRDNASLGLKQVEMPALKEITEGKVLFQGNPSLGFVNTIDWQPILRGREDHVNFLQNAYNESVTNGTASNFCNNGPRWGDDNFLCQRAEYQVCHEDCNGRCFGPDANQCCHSSCAVGCTAEGSDHCLGCKDYIYDGHCAGFCPAKSYPLNQDCIKYD